ncbi:MAG: ATP-binding protein [Firmicutes bacterium]|nr:ATP-binding protein [Bacillota bacterium]
MANVYLAGAFGTYLHKGAATEIGLLPRTKRARACAIAQSEMRPERVQPCRSLAIRHTRGPMSWRTRANTLSSQLTRVPRTCSRSRYSSSSRPIP